MDRTDEPDCQFMNPMRLAQFDRLPRDQVRAHTNRGGAGEKELSHV